jgi:predicted nucleotidyltransferase
MGKSEAIEKVRKYADTIIPEFNPNMIVLFGSYAKGTEREYSDIDVAVIVDEIKGDYLDALSKLYKMRRKIDVRIEPHIFERGNDDSGMLHEVLTTGNILYQA